jgi:alkylation response protein AidB-like acyl-CoA dehydrogenase
MNDEATSQGLDRTTIAQADLVARARALAPMVEAAASRIETARELTPEVVLALHEAGLFRALLPRSLAGYEVSPVVFVKAIEELAKADASTAWCVAQMAAASTISASLDHAVAREIFSADPRSLMAVGPPSASGRAVAAPDGYKVTGTWQFASGSRHANWIAAHCPIFEADGTPRLEPGGLPVQRTLIFPKGSVTMSDVWPVMGLKGTGSDTYAVTDLFVPAERTTAAFGRDPAEKRERGPLYQFTTFQLHGASFAAIALGIARAVLHAFVDLARSKTPYGHKYILRDNAVIQSQIGFAQSQIASSRTFLHHALAEMWQGAGSGSITVEQRVQLRMASSLGSHQARQVVDTIYHSAGATAIFESNPFERRFRDVHTVSQQVQSHFAVFEAIGQYFVGLPLHPRLI